MREYEVRRGTARTIEGNGLHRIATEVFGDARIEAGKVLVSYGALDRMVAWTDGKKLFVETTMRSGVPDAVATDTIKAFNRFLETTTGFNAKERRQRAAPTQAVKER